MRLEKKWLILLGMTLAQAAMFIDQTAIGIAQPTIQKAFNLTTGKVVWITNAFFLAMAVFISIGGRLGDLLQYKRAFLLGIFIFAAGSFFAAVFSTDIFLLLFNRFIQGIGMAIAVPNAFVIIIRSFSSEDQGKAMGLFLGVSLFILCIGLFVASSLIEHWSWLAIFWIDTILAIISFLIAWFTVDKNLSSAQNRRVDWGGLITYTLGIFSLVYVIMEYPYLSWNNIILISCIAVVFLIACIFVEKKHTDPIIDFNLFKNDLFLCAVLLAFCITITISLYTFDTLYYQEVLGYGPLVASALFLPNIICQIISGPTGGIVYDKYGYQLPILLGLIFCVAGLLINAWMVHYQIYWLLIPGIILINIGTPFIITSARTIAITSVSKNEQGIASGIYNIFDILGAAMTLALLTLVIVSTFRYFLQHFLAKFQSIYSTLTLNQFEKIMNQSESFSSQNSQLSESQVNALVAHAKFSFTTGYSAGLLFCALVLTMVLIYVAVLFKRRVERT